MSKPSKLELLRPSDSILIQVVRYGITGFTAFLIDFGILVFLTGEVGIHYLLAACWGFLGGLIVNYQLSIHWVFSNRNMADRKAEFSVFALVGLTGLLVTEIVLWTGTGILLLDYRVSKIIAVAIVLSWNFGLRKYFLFRNATPI